MDFQVGRYWLYAIWTLGMDFQVMPPNELPTKLYNFLNPSRAPQQYSFPRRRKAVARRSGAATCPKPVTVHFIPCNPFCVRGCGISFMVWGSF